MGTFTIYDSSQPDLRDEIAASKTNPLEPGRQYARVVGLDGLEMSDPEWELAPLAPLLETMADEADFGDAYDGLPDKFSKDLYDTHELWLVLMYINGAKHRGEFRGPRLKYIRAASTAELLAIIRFGVARAQAADADGLQQVTDLTVRQVFST